LKDRSRKANRRSLRRGATVVEFAVVAPVLFLLLFGLFEFARMLMVQQALTNAAREGCRKAVLATTTSHQDVEARIRQCLQPSISDSSDANKVSVTVSPTGLNGIASETPITTTVEVMYSTVSWTPPWFLGNARLRGQATMERE